MEDSMIEQPCSGCCRVMCNCPPEAEEDEQPHLTPECLLECESAGEHVMGCPHGPDWDLPNDWEPDLSGNPGAESGRERQMRDYSAKYHGGIER
jgi:hypothetical protein